MNMKQAARALILGPVLVWVALGILVVGANKLFIDAAANGLEVAARKILTAFGQGA